MIVIADSSSSRTHWAIIDGAGVEHEALTEGLNPIVLSRREMSHIIRLKLPKVFLGHRWDHVYFYGIGCKTPLLCKTVANSLTAQFRSRVTVEINQLGVARSLLGDDAGIACILSNNATCCRYNGHRITDHVQSLGYMLGEEGSSAYMGKRLVAECIKGVAPANIANEFFESLSLTPEGVIEAIYSSDHPAHMLADYYEFILDHRGDDYIEAFIRSSLEAFERGVLRRLHPGADEKVNFAGRIASELAPELRETLSSRGITVGTIVEHSMPGLVAYHSTHPDA